MVDTVIAPDLLEDYDDFEKRTESQKENGWRCYARGLIERVSKAEQDNVALRDKIERLEGPFTYSECEQSHELAKSDFKDGIDELVHCVDNANRYLARRFSIEAARGREGESEVQP